MDCGADKTRDDVSSCPGKLPVCKRCRCTVTRCRCPKSAHDIRVACGKLGGRPRRYDLSGFRVGQSITLPWRVGFNGERLPAQDALHEGVRREEKRLAQKFERVGRPAGLLVTRVE